MSSLAPCLSLPPPAPAVPLPRNLPLHSLPSSFQLILEVLACMPLLGCLSESSWWGELCPPQILCQPVLPHQSASWIAAGIGHWGAPRTQPGARC